MASCFATKNGYISASESKLIKKKGTFLSQTLKVEENKAPSDIIFYLAGGWVVDKQVKNHATSSRVEIPKLDPSLAKHVCMHKKGLKSGRTGPFLTYCLGNCVQKKILLT